MTRTVLQGGSVFDGTGSPVVRADVAFERGRIVAVGRDLRGDVHLDLRGQTLLPGLVDCHVDLLGDIPAADGDPLSGGFYAVVGRLARLLDAGVTTARDGGRADPGLRVALEDGLVEGPRLQVSIEPIRLGGGGDGWGLDRGSPRSGAVGRPGQLLAGPDELRRSVRALARAGADYLRLVCPDPLAAEPASVWAELEAVVAEAGVQGLAVAARTSDDESLLGALSRGVRSVEHDGPLGATAVAALTAGSAWLVPVGAGGSADGARRPGGAPVARIAIGTADRVEGDLLDVLGAMAARGVPAERALVAATSAGAELLGLGDEIGTIAPGRRADALVVDGDPCELGTLRGRIRAVFRDGVRVR